MSLSQVARLEEKVKKQAEKVVKEEERLKIYQNQLQEAMYSTFITYHASSQIRFQYEAGELSKQEVLENFRQPYSFKQLSIHNQEFCDIMKIDKVYLSDTGKELDQW